MTSTGNDIQQVVAGLLSSRPYSHRQDVAADVAAVIAVEDDMTFFPDTLRAVLSQRMLPGMIVVADCTGATTQPVQSSFSVIPSPSGPLRGMPKTKTVSVRIVRTKGAVSFFDAVSKSLSYAGIDDSTRALWLLHDDSRPNDDECLARLLDAWRNTPTASLLGVKQLDWSGRTLHDVGAYAGRHRIETLVVDGETDQEQYDSRRDVFAVSLAGALVPTETLRSYGGVNPWFGSFGESEDFCRRVCLGGGRVVVVPQAAVAHRRARFEGVRTHGGHPVESGRHLNSAMRSMEAAQRYRYTDVAPLLWPFIWVWSIIASLPRALSSLFAKRPYEACCEIALPWHALVGLPRGLAARRLVGRFSRVPLKRLPGLVASRAQSAQWRERTLAFMEQGSVTLLGPLARAHLRRRLVRRWALAIGCAVAAGLYVIILYRGVFFAALAGGSLYSDALLPTAADYGQLARAATTLWSFAGSGAPAPPTPWLMVWLAVATVCFGHVEAALTLMFFAAAPLAFLAFWALAGVFTRSDAIRVVGSLLWVASLAAFGLFARADLPMLTVAVFLPAAFAFVFRAVGMYRTEDGVLARSSVQAAAWSALCFVPVVAAEPQLLLALIAVFVVFLAFVRAHRAMLLLIPLPAAWCVAPTLVNVARYFPQGAWRQLFAGATLPSVGVDGSPRSDGFVAVAAHALGLPQDGPYGWLADAALVVVALALVAFAAVALLLPFALRATRLMWVVALCGAVVSMISVRVAVGLDATGVVAGSSLPGMLFMLMGLLSCTCMVAGGAVKRFEPLRRSASEIQPDAGGKTVGGKPHIADSDGDSADRPSKRNADRPLAIRPIAIRVGRVLLAVVLAAGVAATAGVGVLRANSGHIAVSDGGLPIVAGDYLHQDDARRILAVTAVSGDEVRYSVMRTGRGDLVDVSAAVNARLVSETDENHERAVLSDATARLLAGVDADAIGDIASLGFGGIFVTSSGGDDSAAGRAEEQLATNITASNGTEAVVSGADGTYYRLTIGSTQSKTIDTTAQRRAETSGWRYAWLWSLALLAILYVLVALPHGRRTREEL